MIIPFGKFRDREADSLIGDDSGERWVRWVAEKEDFTNQEIRSYIIEHVLPKTRMPFGKHKDIQLAKLKELDKQYCDYMIEHGAFQFLKYV